MLKFKNTIAMLLLTVFSNQAMGMYDAQQGRFLQQDPLGITPNPEKPNKFEILKQYRDDLNLYGYVKSNPVNYVDQYGLITNFICCSQSQINTLKQNEITAQSQIIVLKSQINNAIVADNGQYPWFTNYKLHHAINILNSASSKINSCTVKCSKSTNPNDPYASAWPLGNTITVYHPYWSPNLTGTEQASTLVHEGTHMGAATTDAAYFWQNGESPHDILFIGWDIIASTYDTWILTGFCVPGYNCP